MAKKTGQLSDFVRDEKKRLKKNLDAAKESGVISKEEIKRREDKIKGLDKQYGLKESIPAEEDKKPVKNAKNKKNEKPRKK